MKNKELGEHHSESFPYDLYPDIYTLREISFYLVTYYFM